MRAQQRNAFAAEAALLIRELPEQGRQAAERDPGARQGLEPCDVRLRFQLAAVAQVAELVNHDGGNGAHVTQHHGQHRRPTRGVDHLLQRVPLLDVLHLVGQHPRQFLGAARRFDHPGVHDDDAARQRVGIDLALVADVPAVLVARPAE